MIYLRSFYNSPTGFSVARWATSWWLGDRVSLAFLGARAPNGSALMHLEPEDFRKQYYDYLKSINNRVSEWLATLDPQVDINLCCWCNMERQKKYTTLYCHRILIGCVIAAYRPDIPVVFMDGAENPVWKDDAIKPDLDIP